MNKTKCYLGMGGNLGNPIALFDEVVAELCALPQAAGVRESPRFESAPVDATGPNYVNSVIELFWQGTPLDLLKTCMSLESIHGRVRSIKNAPRLIDLDVLLFGDSIIQSDELTVPHPRMHLRRFVLQPLLALSPDLEIPGLGRAALYLPSTLNQEVTPLNA
ncbi:MAG: 2-amino-4-hydroxy-6-hydroxymethyldihydropteridine diphosphokinase [Limnobacter sp.]|nr:2-amino-4-hydroxy-6-hydroxymethyldihydropteridine diphosphokinase [Limnobacter sp.]